MFTTYYIKKTAANFTLNRVLLLLNAYFCFNKKFFYRFIAFITIFSVIKKNTGQQNFFDILPVRRLKKVENHWFELKVDAQKVKHIDENAKEQSGKVILTKSTKRKQIVKAQNFSCLAEKE